MFDFTIPTHSISQSPRSIVTSIAVHGVAVFLLFAIRFSAVARFPVAPEHFTLLAPPKELPRSSVTAPILHTREFRATQAALIIPATPVILAPAIEPTKAALPEIPKVDIPIAAVPVIKPSGFQPPKPADPAPAPKLIVKTSGFENAQAPAASQLPKASTIGSFDSSSSAEHTPARNVVAHSGGFSDASAASAGTAPSRKAMSNGAFGDTTLEKPATTLRTTTAAARTTPVEIISKPRPIYTPEARAKRIEGEVLLEVQFNASGDLQILRLVRGLGAGLDETASVAARGIRFHPAMRDGAPVDSTALVHIVFQLAN